MGKELGRLVRIGNLLASASDHDRQSRSAAYSAIRRAPGPRWYDNGMKRAVKVAISLSDELLHRVDRARRERKVSRSEYFRQAAANFLGPAGDRDVDRYVRGYSIQPETADEVEAARAASSRILAAEPWE